MVTPRHATAGVRTCRSRRTAASAAVAGSRPTPAIASGIAARATTPTSSTAIAAVIVGSPSCWTFRTMTARVALPGPYSRLDIVSSCRAKTKTTSQAAMIDGRRAGTTIDPKASTAPAPLARAARTWSAGRRSTEPASWRWPEGPELGDVGHQDDGQRVAQPAAVREQDRHGEGGARDGEPEGDRGAEDPRPPSRGGHAERAEDERDRRRGDRQDDAVGEATQEPRVERRREVVERPVRRHGIEAGGPGERGQDERDERQRGGRDDRSAEGDRGEPAARGPARSRPAGPSGRRRGRRTAHRPSRPRPGR